MKKDNTLNQLITYISKNLKQENQKKENIQAIGSEAFKLASLGSLTYLGGKLIDMYSANNTKLF